MSSFGLSVRVFFFQAGSFVVQFFAARQGNVQFCQAFFREVQKQRDHGDAFVLQRTVYFFELVLFEQQFPIPRFQVVGVGAQPPRGNMQVLDPELTVHNQAVSIHQTSGPLADGFYFGTHQDHPRREGVDQFVFKSSTTVFNSDCFLGWFRHGANFARIFGT